MRTLSRHLPLLFVLAGGSVPRALAQEDVAGVPSERIEIEGDAHRTYFLIPPKKEKAPRRGFALLLVLPGGDGSEGFLPFVKRIREHAAPNDFAVAQLVAPRFADDQVIVWPTGKNPVEGMEFTTEQFVRDVVADVSERVKIDSKRVFAMAWSSSGPAVYAAMLERKPSLRGAYISMSVFKPDLLPPLARAKKRRFYIEHSPDDRICPFRMAEQARDELKGHGAKVEFHETEGGHGWRGDVYGRIRRALEWLDGGSR